MDRHPQTVTVEEAAGLLGIGRTLAYRLARDGELPGVIKLGPRRVVVARAALEELLASGKGTSPREV